jgi:hypothetical protein
MSFPAADNNVTRLANYFRVDPRVFLPEGSQADTDHST